MRSIAVLAALGAELNHAVGAPALPSLFFLTDPVRTPEPEAVAARLPAGAAVIYRHFGADDRETVAARLARLCTARGLTLLIGADPELARAVGADGVHWPERLIPTRHTGFPLETAAVHSRRALAKAARAGMNAALLGPVFPSHSPSARRPLGPTRAASIVRGARLPVIALGGINPRTALSLRNSGFAGLAAIEALAGF